MAVRTTSSGHELTREQVQQRTVRVVMASQVFGGAGLAAGVTVGALLAAQMLATESLTGLPIALFTFGSAGAAWGVGRISSRFGRRTGLALGYAGGSLGGAGVVVAAATDSVWLLLLSLLVYGAGTATNLQARYSTADLALPEQRGKAVSAVLFATTFGAVLGPNILVATGETAVALGVPPLAGPFGLAAVAYAAAGLVLFVWLRPDPLLMAARFAEAAAPAVSGSESPAERAEVTEATGEIDSRGVFLGGAAMVLTQIAMVAVMTMTPVHMVSHGHGLGPIGFVISVHIAAMYLPSPVTGYLVDRVGRTPMLLAAGLVLAGSGVTAAVAPVDSVAWLAFALLLLGLGWNIGLIAGTSVLTDAVTGSASAKIQGRVDACVALAGAAGGLGSGFVVASSDFATLSLVGGALGLVMLPLAVGWRGPRSTPTQAI